MQIAFTVQIPWCGELYVERQSCNSYAFGTEREGRERFIYLGHWRGILSLK